MSKSKTFGLMLGLSILFGSAAQADVVYTTNFNSPTYTDAELIGQDGWAITGTSVVNPLFVANTGTDGNVTLTTTDQDANRTFTPVAAASLTSIELSADILVTAAQATGDYFIHLGDGGTSNFYSRIYARSSTNAGFFQMAMGTSSGAGVTYGADIALNSIVNIRARYDVLDGLANDTGELFINGNSYIAATTIGIDPTGNFGSVNLRQGTAANAPSVTVDNITVTTTAIPEPTSALLLGLGLMGLVGYRRR